jgi:hypothetical protein
VESENAAETQLNPWKTIWFQPRETVRQVLDASFENKFMFWLLVIAGGVVLGINRASMNHLGDQAPSLSAVLLQGAAGGIVWGLLFVFIAGMILALVGKSLGGQAKAKEVRIAIAYSWIPHIYGALLWIPALLLFGIENFTSETPGIESGSIKNFAYYALSSVDFILGVWTIVIFIQCLAEAHRFSAWKSIFTVVISLVILAAAFMAASPIVQMLI